MFPLGIRPGPFPSGTLFYDETRHMGILGATGSGKSTLISRIAVEYVRKGLPGFFLDPHGTFISTVLDYIPASRLRDVIVWDPLDPEKQIGLNPLKPGDEVSADAFIEILANQFGEHSFMGRSRMIARNFLYAAVHVLHDPKPFDLWLMFMFDDYAKEMFDRCTVATIKLWGQEYFSKPEKQREEAVAAPMNKADAFAAMEKLRHVFAQAEGLDFFACMQSKKLVFFNLRKGEIGEDAANLLGSVILRMILNAALRRDPHQRNDLCPVIVDEFHNFSKGGNAPDQILAETRKYGLAFVLVDQTFGQLSESAVGSIFTNVSTLVSFCVSRKDAEILAGELRVQEPATLIELRPGEAYAKVKRPDGVFTNEHIFSPIRYASNDRKQKFPLYMPAKRGDEATREAAVRYSQANHGRRRRVVETMIAHSLETALQAKRRNDEHRDAARPRPRKTTR